MKKIRGITLIEILITILILSILAGVAGPSFMRSFETRKLVSATEELYSNIQLARSEALTRSTPIYIRTTGMGGRAWRYGVSQQIDCDPNISDNSSDSACILVIDDGDSEYVKGNDNVLHTVNGSDYEDIKLQLRHATSLTNLQLTFSSMNGTQNRGTIFVLTNSFGDTTIITLSILGTAKVCSNDIVDYRACT